MTSEPGVAASLPRFSSGPRRADDRRDDARMFSALGSSVRTRILESVAARAKSIPELAQELRFHRVTLRYHITYLLGQGFIEKVEAVVPRKVGRPAARYRASTHARVLGFPERHYDLLGQFALEAFVDAVGKDAASTSLEKKGADVGRSMIEGARTQARVAAWTPDAFERVVLGGLFHEIGIASEVLSKSSKTLVYRSFSCPFLELAEKMPEMVCNSLDTGFHRGVDEALGSVRTDRLACMGHGDSYCAYRVTWGGRAPSKLPRRRAREARPRKERQTDG